MILTGMNPGGVQCHVAAGSDWQHHTYSPLSYNIFLEEQPQCHQVCFHMVWSILVVAGDFDWIMHALHD
jgi:hypothetical protein